MADKKLIIGFETNCVPDLNALLDDARKDQFDFVTVPLVHPRFKRDALGVSSKREDPLTRSDFLLDSRQWSSLIVGKISEWLDMDSTCEASALAGELAFKQEMAWATHLALAAVLAPTPAPGRCSNYARCINQVVQELTYMAVWLRIPLIHPEDLEPDLGDSDGQDVGVDVLAAEGDQGSQDQLAGDGDEHALGDEKGLDEDQNGKRKGQGKGKGKVGGVEDPWETWNTVRVLCEHKGCLSVALEMTEDLPPQSVLDRWVGEPVKAVIVSTRVFLTNRKGFPTLSRRHQDFVTAMIKQKTQFVVKGRSQHPSGYLPYLQYLEHLRTRLPPPKKQDAYETLYYDYLQAPLQPLADNLESQTYEAFEKDPVKYAQYERAVVKALELEKEKHKDRDITVLMVVGAGRGPLVQASLNAGVAAERALKVYAVEKNPNAVITLRNRAIMNGWDNVTIVGKDMRHWEPAEKADILVSELLGSWGDNELSPECLDGAQRFLKEGGVSIPQEYTSWVAPMSSHKLWREVSNFEELKRLETAYVVKLHNFLQLAEEKPCFTFRHPNPDINSEGNNKRHIEIHFDVHQASTLHGFAGFFDSCLFADIHISIVPATFSEGMFSWFPLYIPIRTPVVLKPGDKVSAHFWRCTSSTKAKVWYEWALTSPSPSPIHNPNGRSYWIGL